VLAAYFGTDRKSFTIGSEFPGAQPRTFPSFSAAVEDVNDSRVYGGIHFRRAVEQGSALGAKVGAYVYNKFLSEYP
jgi:hypothetical protein